MINFDFEYEYYVTALAAAVLDPSSADHTRLVKFLDKAQGINYEEADNNLELILDSTSDMGAGVAAFAGDLNVDLTNYPLAASSPPPDDPDVPEQSVTACRFGLLHVLERLSSRCDRDTLQGLLIALSPMVALSRIKDLTPFQQPARVNASRCWAAFGSHVETRA